MENLLTNTNGEIDLNTMTDEELDLISTKVLFLKQKNTDKKLTELANKQKRLEEENELNKKSIHKNTEDLEKTKKFIDVLGFAVNSYKFEILKGKAKSRVYELLDNDTSSVDFMVWSSYFFIKVYSDIAHHFKVNKCANINVEHFEEACNLAEYWTPSEYYIKEKIQEMRNKVINGTLKQERVMALNMYLKTTNNGETNPFVG